MRVHVLKPIPAGDRVLKTGEILDPSHWPPDRLRKLLEHRWVAIAPEAPRERAQGRGDK